MWPDRSPKAKRLTYSLYFSVKLCVCSMEFCVAKESEGWSRKPKVQNHGTPAGCNLCRKDMV